MGSWLVPRLVGPSTIKKMITPEEEALAGWTEQDYQDSYQLLLDTNGESEHAKGIEARLGVSKIWQFEVCDKFAVESGCGLVVERDVEEGKGEEKQGGVSELSPGNQNQVKIRIHACQTDKLASLQSVEWITKRCYGNTPIHIEEDITSHESMTFMGGPPKNPLLFYNIARDWGLRD
ncbi:MAG: hypothetical protein SGARI_005601 [Bacillariaceae sp.]